MANRDTDSTQLMFDSEETAVTTTTKSPANPPVKPVMKSLPAKGAAPVRKKKTANRTRETAELIFGRATVSNAVRGGPAQADGGRYAELKTLFATPVSGGVDLAIVSHGNPYRAIVGGPYLAEGEAAVIEPRGKEGFRVVAQIRKEDW